ncbi:hypothetical protein D3C72_1876210 [compost metagenome]
MTRHWRISHHDISSTHGPRNASSAQLAPARLPMVQNVRSRSWASLATKVNRPIIAPATALMAMPASSSPATPGTRRPSV